MFSEILKIIPKLDSSSLNAMEKGLSTRFSRVAKKFGSGMKNVLLGGGIAGAAMAIVNKILNPLKETQEAIERTLALGDDLDTYAKEFGSKSGELAKLQLLAGSVGLEKDSLNFLLMKFQNAVAEATTDKNKPSAVRNYVGQTNMVEGFFNFMQNLQKMPKAQQIMVQQDVFGERQMLKMSEFLGTNFADQLKLIGNIPVDKLTEALTKISTLENMQKVFRAQNAGKDILDKAGVLGDGTISAMNAKEIQDLKRETERVKNAAKQIAIDTNIQKISDNMEKLAMDIMDKTPVIMDALNTTVGLMRKSVEGWQMIMNLFKGSRLLKYFGGGDK